MMMRTMIQQILEETHPIQLAVIAVVLFLDIAGLLLINQLKARTKTGMSTNKWEYKRNVYLFFILLNLAGNCALDAYFPINAQFLVSFKAYVTAFPIGLVDFVFSETKYISPHVFLGAALWWLCNGFLPKLAIGSITNETPVNHHVMQEISVQTVAINFGQFLARLMGVGMLSDLLFSPMHRLMHHHQTLYKKNHSVHHEFSNQDLTSLVLYYGTLVDDFLMPFSVTIGVVAWWWLVHEYFAPFSNFGDYLMVPFTLFSHAHDEQCAYLMVPMIPDSLNFVAYHHKHHLDPSCHYGLTLPSDLIWDWILGVDTSCSSSKLEKKVVQQKLI